jgi:FimV-like protein
MFCAAFVWAGLSMPALAEDKVWEIKSNDTLGVIIAKTYPGYANRQAIMQELLKGNPDAFANKDINHLIVGKKLDLPDASKISGLQPPPPEKTVDVPDAEQKLKGLEARRVELEASVKSLEAENQAKKAELEKLNAKLQAQQQVAEEAKTQLTDARRENGALLNDLQQARAATALAEKKVSGFGSLPWILLGLLTLVTLPLLWLLWQKREQPLAVAVLPVEGKPAEREVPQNERVVPSGAVAVSGVSLAEAVPVLPEEESPAVIDDSPDAGLKLDIARAYMDLRDTGAAVDMLQDVLLEGGSRQRQEAREILSFIA